MNDFTQRAWDIEMSRFELLADYPLVVLIPLGIAAATYGYMWWKFK